MDIFIDTPLARERMKNIRSNLKHWATAEVRFDFDPTGTDLYSIFELSYAYAKRCDDFATAIDTLLEQRQTVPATIVGRALIETVAMGTYFISEMERLVQNGNVESIRKKLTAFWAGSKSIDVKGIHVNDALRHLDKIDAAYVKYLDEKYLLFEAFPALIEKQGKDLPPLEVALSAMKNYDFLSEISHPNGLGVHFIYPQLGGIDTSIKKSADELLDLYKSKARMAIFQCHHLITALERTGELARGYKKAFMDENR
jgi:hypothetical protein